ncbi:patatin-like phospholipase family protein [Rubeoparvulum massiliense]|uniref:patatin-like phospholipase family protein n=1 Tax=Rubeoparvulum massiliense TaxID=1631346 RepID=UPI00065DE620|nr:patatin-like phospholipase family protein [Rubeoparvulum massiliense]
MKRPKIGIALGAGGAKGLAHIGVLRVLEKYHVPIDFIAGSSMGSLVGATYANGVSPDMLGKLAIELKSKYWMDVTIPKMGFVQGERTRELIQLLTHRKKIEELPIPLRIVATDLTTGEAVIFAEGPVDVAVRASIAIPGVFVPVELDGRILVDGGVVDRVPIGVVRQMGADFVIASDVTYFQQRESIASMVDVVVQTMDILEKQLYETNPPTPDFLIRPQVGQYSSLGFTEVESIISAGERAAEESIEALLKAIEQWQVTECE